MNCRSKGGERRREEEEKEEEEEEEEEEKEKEKAEERRGRGDGEENHQPFYRSIKSRLGPLPAVTCLSTLFQSVIQSSLFIHSAV